MIPQEIQDVLAALDAQVSRVEVKIAALEALETEVLAGLKALQAKLTGVE